VVVVRTVVVRRRPIPTRARTHRRPIHRARAQMVRGPSRDRVRTAGNPSPSRARMVRGLTLSVPTVAGPSLRRDPGGTAGLRQSDRSRGACRDQAGTVPHSRRPDHPSNDRNLDSGLRTSRAESPGCRDDRPHTDHATALASATRPRAAARDLRGGLPWSGHRRRPVPGPVRRPATSAAGAARGACASPGGRCTRSGRCDGASSGCCRTGRGSHDTVFGCAVCLGSRRCDGAVASSSSPPSWCCSCSCSRWPS
jgi:hypothetical protein